MDTVQRVYDLLDMRNLTLFQFSQDSGIPYITIRRAESRGNQLSVDTIERICDALHITMSEFFAEKCSI